MRALEAGKGSGVAAHSPSLSKSLHLLSNQSEIQQGLDLQVLALLRLQTALPLVNQHEIGEFLLLVPHRPPLLQPLPTFHHSEVDDIGVGAGGLLQIKSVGVIIPLHWKRLPCVGLFLVLHFTVLQNNIRALPRVCFFKVEC